ncbi:MAG: metal-dependent hydrolase [Syntrophus sp. (in: bacteria)]|nr:metal-dependent hydrolase [Syntrophus sp. (in: bacteria)]
MATMKSKEEFKVRVHEWALKLNADIQSLTVRPMKTKWASCTTNGRLTFNTQLLDMEKGLVDYVIVHEMLHFSVPNHGKLWKSLMRAHLGNYEALEAKLNERAVESTTPQQSCEVSID